MIPTMLLPRMVMIAAILFKSVHSPAPMERLPLLEWATNAISPPATMPVSSESAMEYGSSSKPLQVKTEYLNSPLIFILTLRLQQTGTFSSLTLHLSTQVIYAHI